MIAAAFHSVIGEPWIRMDPVRLGSVPPGLGTADRFVTVVDSDSGALLRIDLYGSSDEIYAFEDALSWSSFVFIGCVTGPFWSIADRDAPNASILVATSGTPTRHGSTS